MRRLLALLSLLLLPGPAWATTFTVDTCVDEASDGSCSDGDCTFREALAVCQDNDTVNFNIETTEPCCNATTGVCTISMANGLGSLNIANSCTINGLSQSGAGCGTPVANDAATIAASTIDECTLKIQVDGTSAGGGGIVDSVSGNAGYTIQGVAFFNNRAINYATLTGNTRGITLGKNYFGLNIAAVELNGTADSSTSDGGIRIAHGDTVVTDNIFGGNGYTVSADGLNWTSSGNEETSGVRYVESSEGNAASAEFTFTNNWVGICPGRNGSPNRACPISGDGLAIEAGSAHTISGNRVGNVDNSGIAFYGGSTGIQVSSNWVGTDGTDDAGCGASFPNGNGIFIVNLDVGVTIDGNVVGNNEWVGINGMIASDTVISDNTICNNGTMTVDDVYTILLSPLSFEGLDYDYANTGGSTLAANIGMWYLANGGTAQVLAGNEAPILDATGVSGDTFDLALCSAADGSGRSTFLMGGDNSEASAQTLINTLMTGFAGVNCPIDVYCDDAYAPQGAGSDYTVDLATCEEDGAAVSLADLVVAPGFTSPPAMLHRSRVYNLGGPATIVGSGIGGITLLRASNFEVTGNTITDNGIGVLISFSSGTVVGVNTDNGRNTITDNLSYGILCDGVRSTNNRINNNVLRDNCQDSEVEDCKNYEARYGCNNELEPPEIQIATDTAVEGTCCAADTRSEANNRCGNLVATVVVMALDGDVEEMGTEICRDACENGIFECSSEAAALQAKNTASPFSGTAPMAGYLVALTVDANGNTSTLTARRQVGTSDTTYQESSIEGEEDGDGGGGDDDEPDTGAASTGAFSAAGPGCSLIIR